jgi:hypothetical protein
MSVEEVLDHLAVVLKEAGSTTNLPALPLTGDAIPLE